MPGAPTDVSYKNNTHILGISVHYFPKDMYGQMDAFRSSTSRRLNSSMSPAFCSATASKTPVCYEHEPLVAAVEVFVALCFAPTK